MYQILIQLIREDCRDALTKLQELLLHFMCYFTERLPGEMRLSCNRQLNAIVKLAFNQKLGQRIKRRVALGGRKQKKAGDWP